MSKAHKTLDDIRIEKGFKTYGELGLYIQGRKLQTVEPPAGKSRSSHNYKKKIICDKTLNWSSNGTTMPSSNVVIGNSSALGFNNTYTTGIGIYLYELALDTQTIDELKEELTTITDKFKIEEAELKSNIQTMEELGLTEYDEKFIKIVKAMGNLEFKKGSDMDKVKLAKLLMETF